mgnify:CR=1 FL=1
MRSVLPLLLVGTLFAVPARAQIDEEQLGAWYMYFFNTRIGDSRWGFQGDGQFRNWDMGGDLEQLLLRGGVTYSPGESGVRLTFGYANITTGEFGPGDDTVKEDRIYQEALVPHRVAKRVYLNHRFRYEQRWVENQDFRTRFRYAIFVNVPLNQLDLSKGAVYLAFYDEIFVNGEQNIGDGRRVNYFDRNRLYGAVGYSLTDRLRLQAGIMRQTSENLSKNQFQLSLHHSF